MIMRRPSNEPSPRGRRFIAAVALATLALAPGCGVLVGGGTILGLELTKDDSTGNVGSVPAVAIEAPALGEAVNDRVGIRYRLIDGDAQLVDVTIEFSTDGETFIAATAIEDFGHDGTADLPSDADGVEHVFVWNSSLDLGDEDRAGVLIRITAVDEGGSRSRPTLSDPFLLANAQIATFAGGEVFGDVLIGPTGLALDETANALLIADDIESKVFAIDLATLELSRVAGNELKGFDEDDVAAVETSLDDPTAVLRLGKQILVGTSLRVRSVDVETGFIKTAIGTGDGEDTGDGLIPQLTGLADQVFGLDGDAAGNIYFTDETAIRVVNRQAVAIDVAGELGIAPGTTQTIGGGSALHPDVPQRVTVGPNDELYVIGDDQVFLFATQAALTAYPDGPAIVVPVGELVPIAGLEDGDDEEDGGLAIDIELALEECDIVIDAAGERAFLSTVTNRIHEIDLLTGELTTIAGTGDAENAGDGGPANEASVQRPRGLALSEDDLLFVACTGAIRVVNVGDTPAILGTLVLEPGAIETIASAADAEFLVADDALAVDPDDDSVFTMDKTDNALIEILPDTRERIVVVGGGGELAGDGGLAADASSAGYNLALDPDGNLVIGNGGRIRVVNRQTVPIVVAGVTIPPGFIDTIAGDGDEVSGGDGGAAIDAGFVGPESVAVGPDGTIYLADELSVRAVNPGTTTRTILGVSIAPGEIETVIGNGVEASAGDGDLALNASCVPLGLAVDAAGTVYLVDAEGSSVRAVNAGAADRVFFAGGTAVTIAPREIETLVGTGAAGFNGDGLPSIVTELTEPKSIFITADAIFVCDPGARRLRRVDGQTGTVETVLGTGDSGFNGDAVPLVNARASPELVTTDSLGRFYVLDGTGRVRRFFLD